ncbi:MAG: CBS domain-containing protein [Planctomycetaceae bacterium]
MRVRDIMTAPAVVVGPDEPLRAVARLLIEQGVSGAPVVDGSGTLVGMVTEADLIALEVEAALRKDQGVKVEAPAPKVAGDVMTRVVVSVEEDAPISEVASLMVHHGIRRVPVLRDGEVVGIVSRRDVIGTLTRSDEDISADVQELLDDVIKVIGWFRASVSDGVVTLTGPSDEECRRLAARTARSVPGVMSVRFSERATTSA